MNCDVFLIVDFIFIIEAKDPHFSEVNEKRRTIGILLLHLYTFGAVIKGKADLTDGGRLLVLDCIDNEVFVRWVLIGLISIIFFIGDEVDVWLNFAYFANLIADYTYLFVDFHFSELFFGVAP